MPDYTEQNAAIARIMAFVYPHPYCEDDRYAAEFRQHTMRQEWCVSITLNDENRNCRAYIRLPWNDQSCAIEAETEAAASSLACLAAWQAMEQTANDTATAN